MRILFIPRTYPPSSGAPTELVYLTEELAARGHAVRVYTTNIFNRTRNIFPGTRVIERNGVSIHYFHRACGRGALYFAPELFRAIKRVHEFDVVHLNGMRGIQNVVAFRHLRRWGIPWILTAQGTVRRTLGNRPYKLVFDVLIGRRMLQAATRLHGSTPMERDDFLALGAREDQVVLIPNGIDPGSFSPLPPFGRFRSRYDLHGIRIALFLGRFHPIKGPDLLVRAAHLAAREVPELRLVLAGADEGLLKRIEGDVRRLNLEDRVVFPGFLTGEEKLEALVDSDCVVVPSRYDFYPNVAMEALACSRPLIVTDTCGCAPLVAEMGAGMVVPVDVPALARALVEILRAGDGLQGRVARARAYLFENLNYKRIADRFEALYAAMIRETRGA